MRIDEVTATWVDDETAAIEHLRLGWENNAWTAEGILRGAGVQYVLRLDPTWQCRQFILFRDASEPDLWLARDGHSWGEVNGVYRPDLAGCATVVLREAPFTVGAVARRLVMAGDASRHVLVAVLDVERLTIEPTVLDVRRITSTTWTIDSVPIELDLDGIVGDLSPRFRRVT